MRCAHLVLSVVIFKASAQALMKTLVKNQENKLMVNSKEKKEKKRKKKTAKGTSTLQVTVLIQELL